MIHNHQSILSQQELAKRRKKTMIILMLEPFNDIEPYIEMDINTERR